MPACILSGQCDAQKDLAHFVKLGAAPRYVVNYCILQRSAFMCNTDVHGLGSG